MTQTTVVIPHFRARTLSACLASLYEHTHASLPVVVVDDGGDGPALQEARRAFPQVCILRNDRRLGFSGSCNHGLAAAQTSFVLLLNDDTRVTAGWLAPLERAMAADAAVGACQPKLLSASRPHHFDYSGGAGGYIDRLGYTFCRGRLFDTVEADEGQYDAPAGLFWACGSALFLRRAAVEEVGPLDLDYFMHFEEIDLCWRLRLAGWRVVAVPAATIYHHAAQSLPPDSYQKVYLNHRNNLVAMIKNLPGRRLLAVLPPRLLLEAVASLAYLLRGRLRAAVAPWAGMAWILLHPGNLSRRRRQSRALARQGGDGGDEGVFHGVALWRYHVRRQRTAAALMGSSCQ